jgi:hypothetical protein
VNSGSSTAHPLDDEPITELNALGFPESIAVAVGFRLKNKRLSLQLNESFISRKIKVREKYIVAIENGSWNILPSGLNGRGLIRLYAKELDMELPEFEKIQNQSSFLSEKPSTLYQEDVKIISRSEYERQKSHPFFKNPETSSHTPIEIGTSSPVYNEVKTQNSRVTHSSSIVTPKLSDVL